MMVDKAVCTNDTPENLTKVFKYEAVFSSLVENKILAIKRDCEEKKNAKKKKKKGFSRLLLGRSIFGGGGSSSKRSSEEGIVDVEKRTLESRTFSKEEFPCGLDETNNVISSEIQLKQYEDKFKGDIESDAEVTSFSLVKPAPRDVPKEDSNGSNDNGSLTERGATDLIVEVLTHRQGISNDSNNDGDSNGEKDSVVLNVNDKNVETSSLDSLRVEENTSTGANGSLMSNKVSVESLSYPSSRCTVSGEIGTSISYEKERSRLRILEAKSISAQCSPILPRQMPLQIPVQQQILAKMPSEVSYSNNQHGYDASRFISRQNTSEDSANLTISTLLNEAGSISALGERKCKSTSLLVIADKDNKKAINHLDSNSFVNYPSNPLVRGLISSFSQLTTASNYFPVITTTVTTLPTDIGNQQILQTSDLHSQLAPSALKYATGASCGSAKLQRMTSTSTGSSVVPTGCCTTKSKEKEKLVKPDWYSGQSGSDDEYRKRKRKYKRHHRCSDPVLVYPSSGGLQHCILSMPPNQPIQFHYSDDFVYDMTLQVESEKNGDLEASVPHHKSKRHKHHKHKKQHRHKKPKILIHDLDTQSVKVIDPDDLPQRARWTIIATACLLLLMCLMLVGITLRMAPIIDDMVRQENERLMQESMNRARFAKNFTEPSSLAAAEEIP